MTDTVDDLVRAVTSRSAYGPPSDALTSAYRAVLLRHSRSLVDHDGQPTPELLGELAAVGRRHAVATRPARTRIT